LKQQKYQILFCTGMMHNFIITSEKKTRIYFFSVHFFSVHFLRKNARDEAFEAIAFTRLTAGNKN